MPLDMNILKALKRSSLGLDLYMWLTYRHTLDLLHRTWAFVVKQMKWGFCPPACTPDIVCASP